MGRKRRSPQRLWGEYLLARGLAATLTAIDLNANLAIARGLGQVIWRLDKRHAQRARDHLSRAFPDWDAARVEAVGKASFEHFAQLAVETVHTPRLLTPDNWAGRIRVRGLETAIDRLASDRPVLLVTGHLGNWELLGFFLAVLGFDLDAIARPLDNPMLDRWVMGLRQRRGLRIITKWDATERMLAVLERGGSLGFIADQNAGDKGMFVPFMGRLASTYKSIGLLALQHEASIVCGYAHRLPPTADDPHAFRYEIGVEDVIDPDHWADRRDPLYYITARYNLALEAMIRRRPEQYLWMHRRWKSRPRHERLGKPMPSALRRSLEELPWMTDALLASCQPPTSGGG